MGGQNSVPQTDLSGRVAVITSANTGIGYETAKALAKMGAHTIIACRTESRATEAIQRMRTEMEVESPGKQLNVEYMSLDLASLQATKEFAAAFKERHLPLHILVNNAGIAFVPFGRLIGTGVTVSSVHPGVVGTEGNRGFSDLTLLSWIWSAMSYFSKSPERGAFSSINCASNPSLNSHQAFYYDSDGQQIEPSYIARAHLSPEVLERYGEAIRGSTQSATVEGRHNGSEVEQARAVELTEQSDMN
eukprot:Em0022g19a